MIMTQCYDIYFCFDVWSSTDFTSGADCIIAAAGGH